MNRFAPRRLTRRARRPQWHFDGRLMACVSPSSCGAARGAEEPARRAWLHYRHGARAHIRRRSPGDRDSLPRARGGWPARRPLYGRNGRSARFRASPSADRTRPALTADTSAIIARCRHGTRSTRPPPSARGRYRAARARHGRGLLRADAAAVGARRAGHGRRRRPRQPLRRGSATPRHDRGLLLQTLAGAGVLGGASYDGLVALEAHAHGHVLLSLDRRAQETYRRLHVAFQAI